MPMIGEPQLTRGCSLYFHIPFCSQKCSYCHFYVLPDKEPLKGLLMEGLRQEWKLRLPLLREKPVRSIYFGGGTPYLLGPERIEEILHWIQADLPYDADTEITLEANPENVTPASLRGYARAGINRMSLGIQSLDPTLLQEIGRQHNHEQARKAVWEAHEAGIHNLSVDLMYDLPDQDLQTWRRTLKEACRLPIQHLSLYNMTLEPHTVFFKYREKIRQRMPDEETSLQMYNSALEILPDAGLIPYEISAFAKEGYHSRHNTGYWLGRPFLGFGPSAFSYWEGKRFRNVAHLHRYSRLLACEELPVDFEEQLEPSSQRRELLMIALRLRQGVDLKAFQEQWGPLDAEVLKTLERLQDLQLLEWEGAHLKVSPKGVPLYDAVAAEII